MFGTAVIVVPCILGNENICNDLIEAIETFICSYAVYKC